MRMRNGLSLTAAVAALAGAALTSQAGVIVGMNEVTDLGDPSGGGVSAPGYQAYLLTLQTTEPGEVITAVDFTPPSGMPDAGSRGIYGALLQRATFVDGERTLTPFSPVRNNSATSPTSVDSHFLVPAGQRATVNDPAEDNSGVNPPGSPPDSADTSDFGTGSFLTATFGLRGDVVGAQTARLDLAYVVIADGDIATFNGLIATSVDTFAVSGTIPIPEPTAGLALLAGAGLMGLRRRRA